VRGVVGMDIFSGAMVWDEHIEHLPHNGRERLRLSAVAGVMQPLALGEDLRGPVEHWVAEWAELFSDEFLAVKPHVAVRQNIDMDGTARVLAAADAQARLYETLLKQLPLSNEQREKLLEFDTVFVPLYIGD